MAAHMKNILKDKLYVDPVDAEREEMPSPESLKGKILVKAKRLPQERLTDGQKVSLGMQVYSLSLVLKTTENQGIVFFCAVLCCDGVPGLFFGQIYKTDSFL
jgi:hypothetical protein